MSETHRLPLLLAPGRPCCAPVARPSRPSPSSCPPTPATGARTSRARRRAAARPRGRGRGAGGGGGGGERVRRGGRWSVVVQSRVVAMRSGMARLAASVELHGGAGRRVSGARRRAADGRRTWSSAAGLGDARASSRAAGAAAQVAVDESGRRAARGTDDEAPASADDPRGDGVAFSAASLVSFRQRAHHPQVR